MAGVLSFNRPWLALYYPSESCMLAQRILTLEGAAPAADELPLPFDLWLHLCVQHLSLADACSLAKSCSALRALSRHPELWESFCHAAFATRGFRASQQLLSRYDWSWRTMFMRRPRLRLDGFYFIPVSRLMQGMPEGRGIKEKDVDFYSKAGKWSTYYRIFRFFSSGHMFCYICSTANPVELRKGLRVPTPARPGSLRRLDGANWGTFCLSEADGRGAAEGGEEALFIDGGGGVSPAAGAPVFSGICASPLGCVSERASSQGGLCLRARADGRRTHTR